MSDYLPLTDSAVKTIAEAYFSKRQDRALPQEIPTHVLVGGQPGAGKSAASQLVRDELIDKGGFIHVDADRMREFLPTSRINPPSSEQTQADAGRLVSALRELATQNRTNIVEEGTFRNAEGADSFIQGRKAQGYRVELLAVATSQEVSRVGIYQRHEHQHDVGTANPRMVPDKYHDDALRGFDKTVDTVASKLDRVRVTNRDAVILYDSAKGRDNIYTSAQHALAEGRALSAKTLAGINETWHDVAQLAIKRGAPAPYIDAVREHAQRAQAMQKSFESDRETSSQDASHKRAEVFRTMPQAEALRAHPELKSAYQVLDEASKQFTARNPGVNASVGAAVMKDLREKMAEQMKAGIIVKPMELDAIRQPAERER